MFAIFAEIKIVTIRILVNMISVTEKSRKVAAKLNRTYKVRRITNRSVTARLKRRKFFSSFESSLNTIGPKPKSTNLDKIPTIAKRLLNIPKSSGPRYLAAKAIAIKFKIRDENCPNDNENIFLVNFLGLTTNIVLRVYKIGLYLF